MEMDDDIFHLRVIDSALRRRAPRILGGRIAVVDSDDLDSIHVEVQALRVLDPSAENQVKLAHPCPRYRIAMTSQPCLLTASTAAFADARAASRKPSRRLRIVSSPFCRLRPLSSRRCEPVSRAASKAARALFLTRRAVGWTSRVSASVLGRSAAISAPAAIPPARKISGASPSVSTVRSRALS